MQRGRPPDHPPGGATFLSLLIQAVTAPDRRQSPAARQQRPARRLAAAFERFELVICLGEACPGKEPPFEPGQVRAWSWPASGPRRMTDRGLGPRKGSRGL